MTTNGGPSQVERDMQNDPEDLTTADTQSVTQCSVDTFLDEVVQSWSTSEVIVKTQILEEQMNVVKAHSALIQEHVLKLQERLYDFRFNSYLAHATKRPLLIGHLVEMLRIKLDPDEAPLNDVEKRDGYRQCPVVKTTLGRVSYFLPMLGFVRSDTLEPNDLLAMREDSHAIIDVLPREYDPRVTAMEVTQRPTDRFSDIGALDTEIHELCDAIILPLTHAEKFKKIGIRPQKGVLLYGPPGTGKTMLARATAAELQATFLRLTGTQLVQSFIGEGARMVREAFDLAKEKAPCVLFIDEIDSIGKKRSGADDRSGSREVQRTLVELLNQLDGFQSSDQVKVIAATNRVDVLDPALIRSGRLDRKIELCLPDMEGRSRILKIHSRNMKTKGVDFDELARSTTDFSGAQCKAVCVEAAMIAIGRRANEVTHNDFMDGIMEVQEKKKLKHSYFG